MSNLLMDERVKYEEIWALPGYAAHSPGEMYLPLFFDAAQPERGQSILDAGCGSGKAGLALASLGFEVRLCDLTEDGLVEEAKKLPFDAVCLWAPYRNRFDWVYCCDVLEHVDEALTMLVVARLLDAAKRGVFLTVSTVEDTHGVWIGRTLHQTVKPFIWWRDHLREVGNVVEARDLLTSAVFLVKPC